jgi:hypothetical protein
VAASNAGTYARRLIENEYVQENLAHAAESLRAAYRRASKRRVEPTRDEKLRRQVRQAALSLNEAARTLKSGRRKAKQRRNRRTIVLVATAAGAVVVLLAADKKLRRKHVGGDAEATVPPPQESDVEVAALT